MDRAGVSVHFQHRTVRWLYITWIVRKRKWLAEEEAVENKWMKENLSEIFHARPRRHAAFVSQLCDKRCVYIRPNAVLYDKGGMD